MIRTLLASTALALAGLAPLFAPDSFAQDDVAELAAEAAAEFGPAVGTMAPAFSALDSDGMERSLADLSGTQGVVLYFNRSLDWCPICVRQATEVDLADELFAARGWTPVIVTRDRQAILAVAKDRRGFVIPLLADPDSVIIDAFGVRDPIYGEGHRAEGVPYPIAFAIRSDGEIVGKFWHESGLGEQRGYAVRVTPNDVLNALPTN